MDDLVERLITARDDDHERGCQMRFVVCSCGYDDQTARAVGDAKDRIEALQAEVARLRLLAMQYRDDLKYPPAPDSTERRLEVITKELGDDA